MTVSHTPTRLWPIVLISASLVATAGVTTVALLDTTGARLSAGVDADLDLSKGNRRASVDGLYDWSKAGFRGGEDLPGDGDVNADPACVVTAEELASDYDVHADDDTDDSQGIQRAIDDIRETCSATADFDSLSRITLPAGTLDVSRQLGVDADYLVIRGAGAQADTGTRIVFTPDENTLYDTLEDDGSDWSEDDMTFKQGKGGWMWPGRGLFRVQSREVDPAYREDYADAPANREDLFEGTINVHWKAGVKLDDAGDGYAARAGDTEVQLNSGGAREFAPDGLVNIRAANSMKFYEAQHALPTEHSLQNLHMRQQIFTITAVDEQADTISLNKPLEYDVPVDSTSDGSEPIDGKTYDSKAAPIIDPVVGVGIENLSFTQEVPGLDPADAKHNYGNMAPAAQMHGIVLKWVADSWVRGVRAEMTGSHPLVTEEAYRIQIVGNHFEGSWNKGKGGNGYFRGSRVWDSLYAGNTSRGLRHFTFQWSASGNVVIGNDFDSDLNLHGGWERNNLFELNLVKVPYGHRPGNCDNHCGGEGGDDPDESQWFPLWWGAGRKAVKWSGASGPDNVLHNNRMSKQRAESGEFTGYLDPGTVYQFGWDGEKWQHLDVDGEPIADWAFNEEADYTGGHGVHTGVTSPGDSIFLNETV